MPNVKMSTLQSAMTKNGVDAQTQEQVIDEVRRDIPDNWIYRIVVLAIGLAIFVPLAGLTVGNATADKVEIMQLLLPIATTALGALAGLLAPSPAGE